jgi:hypothetical protein
MTISANRLQWTACSKASKSSSPENNAEIDISSQKAAAQLVYFYISSRNVKIRFGKKTSVCHLIAAG